MEKLGIEGIKESLTKTKDILETVVLVFEDGRLTIGDAQYVPELWSDTSDLLEAAPKAILESKDIDLEEAKVLIALTLEIGVLMAKKLGFIFGSLNKSV